ncbi:S-adenosylmethionine:tRNA ribosyltransferase-isomerase [Polyangium aurulentum]|uniref:S-adenosylmethionine:tRNA ribosyltransferase-isomerase n=1 Tax=Polyangium aurulentum TaxID=2567896 RepID=UPI0010AE2F7C|nr:S-adenosylmethionine:tRNA ribosyltransferase-isomerase [Polyangium aurulentum]UQA55532.1 S-adenosylmethionine:tRNA ribosyltransferase-isomerase [Polyangium aurulentum]
MKAAVGPRADPLAERLLGVDPRTGEMRDARVGDLGRFLRAGDLVVVNDAATLPGSLVGTSSRGEPIEARLAQPLGENRFVALLFGAGDHRQRTEDRPPPPPLAEGSVIAFGDDLEAVVERVSPVSARLVEIAFSARGAALWTALYRHGRPVQYAYVPAPLALWDVQTRYASRPIAAEMPSAGRPLAWELLFDLARRGVRFARVTHAAGLSSTGDPALDARLPLPEHFEIPEATVRAVSEARRAGGRVVAVGTTVTRALEGAARLAGGKLVAGAGVTDLVLGPEHVRAVVDGLFTGMHEPSESHFRLLGAFAPEGVLARAHAHAEAAGYLTHEFGDSMLLLAG